MPTCYINNTFILFFDNTNIIISDCPVNKLKIKLQLTINDIMSCVNANKLTTNIDKTHSMSFRNDIEFEIVI